MRFVLILLLAGCAVPVGPVQPEPSPVKPDSRETILAVFAERVAKFPEVYQTTDDVVRVANRLVASGDMTKTEMDQVVGKLGTVRRKLEEKDVEALRGLR